MVEQTRLAHRADALWETSAIRPILTAAAGLDAALGVVGGSVRDWMLGLDPVDVDLLWTGDLGQLADRLTAAGIKVRHRPDYRTMTVIVDRASVDVASPRIDRYAQPGGVPDIRDGTIDQDLGRRDFTANAMCMLREPAAWHLRDPFAGIRDISDGLLRPVADHTLAEDPIRILRGARYLIRYDWTPAGAWQPALQQATNPAFWATVATGRIWNELCLIADEPKPAEIWNWLAANDIDHGLLPAPINQGTIASLRTWQDAATRHKRNTGRNGLDIAAILAVQFPNLVEIAAGRWQLRPDDVNRIGKRLRQN